jgi:hypothetical protein
VLLAAKVASAKVSLPKSIALKPPIFASYTRILVMPINRGKSERHKRKLDNRDQVGRTRSSRTFREKKKLALLSNQLLIHEIFFRRIFFLFE